MKSAQAALAQTVEDIQDSKGALAAATFKRTSEAALFVKRAKDHKHAMKVVKGALAILDDMVVQTNFIQLAKHTKSLLKSGMKIKMGSSYAPVIALFAQMATSEENMFLDAGAVNRIKNLLKQLMTNISNSLKKYSMTEAIRKQAFLVLKGKLENSIAGLEANKMSLEDHIETMGQCVLEERVLVNASQTKLSRNTKLLNLSVSMCTAFENEYKAATASRDEELELLVEVRKMVKKRLDTVSASVRARDDTFHNEKVQKYDAAHYMHDGGNADHALEGFGMAE